MGPDEKSPCPRCENYRIKAVMEVDASLEGAIVPVNPPLVDGAIVDAESSLADTIVPVEPPLVNDEMVPAGEFTRSRERGLAGFLRVHPISEHLGGPLYRCKAK